MSPTLQIGDADRFLTGMAVHEIERVGVEGCVGGGGGVNDAALTAGVVAAAADKEWVAACGVGGCGY
jgi:hypothetical protein